MAFEKTKDGIAFSCDSCGTVLDPPKLGVGSEPYDWMACWQRAKDKGWRAHKVRSRVKGKQDWVHSCPSC